MLSLQWTETIVALRWSQPPVQNNQNEHIYAAQLIACNIHTIIDE